MLGGTGISETRYQEKKGKWGNWEQGGGLLCLSSYKTIRGGNSGKSFRASPRYVLGGGYLPKGVGSATKSRGGKGDAPSGENAV